MPAMDGISLIVGLGNPGHQYANNRHNVGAWFIERLAQHQQSHLQAEPKFYGLISKATINQRIIWLLEPSTYMNESGKAVAALAKFYKIPANQILVVHDELDFPAGTLKFKTGGGHGGHNGLRDIIACLGTNDFHRLRIGIDHPGHRDLVVSYVLGDPSKNDKEKIEQAIDEGLRIIDDVVTGDFEKVTRILGKNFAR